MKIKTLAKSGYTLFVALSFCACQHQKTSDVLLNDLNWDKFLSQHDMVWDTLSTDPIEPCNDGKLKTGYYAGAIMGNGLLGTNLYKLQDSIYRLNVGRSDVTEVRKPYNLFNSARLPIGYFTLRTVGKVTNESMHLSLYNALTNGTLSTDKGSIDFRTYVHAKQNYIVFETDTKGEEQAYQWKFIPLKAISPRQILNHNAPADYVNHKGDANPAATYRHDGEDHLLIQSLVTDSTMQTIGKVYVVAWRELKKGSHRRMLATVAQETTEQAAIHQAKITLKEAAAKKEKELYSTHKAWWNNYYRKAAFLSFPDTRIESFYWAQYYKFASTTRPGYPIVDLQGVWPTWDTPWTAVWNNLNLQLTYSWQTKANMGWLAEPLWESLYNHRDNLRRNVTDIPGQESWKDAACIGRTSGYDFLSPLNPKLAESNQYEVGNLTWLLYYYWQYCNAYNKTDQLTQRLFPLLKSAINLYFHIRVEKNGQYSLPATASPEYLVGKNVGPNTNYDLSSLRWGLQTLININKEHKLKDPMAPQWKDFLDKLVDYPYDSITGYKVSENLLFENTNHRHYSHLFMIYPYYLVNWGQKANRHKISLSVLRWKGNQGYSRTGKSAMYLSMGMGDSARIEMNHFFDRFVKPNTLYSETGPVIETPLAALSTLHDFYLQDWGGTLRVFHGYPSTWKDGSFVNMRALGGFLVSAYRKDGNTVFTRIVSEQGNTCHIQTDIPLDKLGVFTPSGNKVDYQIIDKKEGIISFETEAGDVVELTNRTLPTVKPTAISHPKAEWNYYGEKKRN